MGLRHWVGQDLQTCSEDRYWGAGESRGHALHQSLHLHRAANQLPVFWVMQRALSQSFPGPTSRATPGEAARRGTPGVKALKTQRQICEVGQVESHTWD